MSDPFKTAMARMYAKLQESGVEEVQDAVYTPAAEDPISCTVRIYTEDSLEPDGSSARVSDELVIIEYQRAEITRDAKRGETFVIGDTEYVIEGIQDRDGVSTRVIVVVNAG